MNSAKDQFAIPKHPQERNVIHVYFFPHSTEKYFVKYHVKSLFLYDMFTASLAPSLFV